jgi:PhnB protein
MWSLDAIEAALVGLPRPEFRARLRADLERRGGMTTTTAPAEAGHAVPTGQRPTASTVLRVRNAAQAIDFYTRAFGARELMRFALGDNIPHAEIEIGNTMIILADAAPALGFPGPDVLGGSPVTIRVDVDDPDAAVRRAVDAGAIVFRPVRTEFYGERTGTVVDPFGYRWSLTKKLETLSIDDMHRRLQTSGDAGLAAREWIPEGERDVTPYLVVADVPAVIDFANTVFDAKEEMRAVGSAGGYHAEIRIGDSKVMIGGGAPELSWRGESKTMPLHVYVPDVDAVYARAVGAGAESTGEPRDMEYGDRECGFVDPGGNTWYVSTHLGTADRGTGHVPAGFGTVTPSLHPLRSDALIAFLTRALGATTMMRYATADGVVHHAVVRIGDSVIEMGDAHGPHQPTPAMFFVRVPDAERTYRTALEAGATSVVEPVDRPYGRTAAVKDAFGNEWHFAS